MTWDKWLHGEHPIVSVERELEGALRELAGAKRFVMKCFIPDIYLYPEIYVYEASDDLFGADVGKLVMDLQIDGDKVMNVKSYDETYDKLANKIADKFKAKTIWS